MPRKPIPTVLSETEIQKLTAASLNSPDPEFARRCKVILECGKGNPTNEQVGAIVGMDRKYVGHWRNMWAENKMDGLKSSQGGGVIPLQDVYSMDEQIALLLEDESKRPDEGWTARSLSAELRISESRVRNAMKRMGLTLERNRNWRFPTKTDPAPTKADLIAVYADQNQQAAVFCVSQKPFTTKDAAAVTRNISLSQDLAKSKEILSLPDFIDTAAMRADEHGLQRPISRNLFLKNVIDAQPENPNLMIQVLFCGGERPIYRGSRVEQVSVFGADSLEKWLGSVEEWSIALNQTELSDPGRGIAASLRHFLDVSDDRTDPILWSKKVLTLPASSDSSDFSSGLPFSLSELMSSEEASASSDVEITADEDVADSEALSDGLASDSSSQTSLQSGSGSGKVQITLDPANPMEALREVMKYVLPTDQLGEKEVGSAFLPLVYDRNSVMCSVVESHDGFPRPDQFDFRTIEGFMNGFNQMEKPMVQLRNKAGEEAAELYNEFIKKKDNIGGILKSVKIDSELGQAELDLPVCLTSSLKAGETLKSGGFLLQISSRACDTSYRKGLDQLNSDSHRDELGCAVSLSTYSYTVIKLGCDLAAQKAEQAEEILEQYGFVDGQWPDGKELPDTMRQEEGLFEAFDPAELDAFSFNLDEAEDWPTVFCCQEEDAGEISEKAEAGEDSKGENAEHAQEKKKKGSYSKPDMRPRDHLKKRRTRKQCIQDDEKRMEFMKAYALWLNTQDCTALKKILHEVMVESKLEKTIYISIDGVCVSEQEAPRVKGGRPTEKEKGTWIDHWNIRVEFGDRSYLITDPDLDSCFRQLLAFLLKHSLLSHAFVFLADGQDSIFLGVKKYFKHWRFLFILDFYHLAEKCYNLLSLGLKSYRVPSPWEKPEYYKTGKKKGQVKSQKKTSISRVYASTIVSYLWYGNVKEAVSYLENLDPADISDQEAINKLIGYFRKRKEFITCYAMRRAAGLRNSSNGVEGANNLLVSARQKEDDRMHWRQKGSWALAALTCARKNGDLEDWCVNRRFSFSKQAWTNGQEYEAAA